MAYKIAAINDETDTCTRCGKSNLKRVAWVYENEGSPADAKPVGLDCLAVLLGYGQRTSGRVAAKAVQRAVLDWYIETWRAFIGQTFRVQVRGIPGKHLRLGRTDYRIEMEGFASIQMSDYGLDHALAAAGQELASHKMRELTARWSTETGLKSAPSAHAAWPADLKHRRPTLVAE